jgi:hypothetical protein
MNIICCQSYLLSFIIIFVLVAVVTSQVLIQTVTQSSQYLTFPTNPNLDQINVLTAVLCDINVLDLCQSSVITTNNDLALTIKFSSALIENYTRTWFKSTATSNYTTTCFNKIYGTTNSDCLSPRILNDYSKSVNDLFRFQVNDRTPCYFYILSVPVILG